MVGLGRKTGGRSVTPTRGEGSGSGQRRDGGPGRGGKGLWGLKGLGESEGLDRVEGVEPDGREGLLFIWSSVSSTRSGLPLCRSSSRSSFSARLMVSSMSCTFTVSITSRKKVLAPFTNKSESFALNM